MLEDGTSREKGALSCLAAWGGRANSLDGKICGESLSTVVLSGTC